MATTNPKNQLSLDLGAVTLAQAAGASDTQAT